MVRPRRTKAHLRDRHAERSRATRYRNPLTPSSDSNAFEVQGRAPPLQHCFHRESQAEPNSRSDQNPSYQERESPPTFFGHEMETDGNTNSTTSSEKSSSPSSMSEQDGSVRFGGIEAGLFNDQWDRDAHEHIMSDSDSEIEDETNREEEDVDHVGADDPLGGFERLRAFLSKEENNEPVTASVDVTNSEILLAVLKYGLTYNLSQTAVADLFKLICVLMGVTGLPSSRYLLDKLFNNPEGVDYHACCPQCKKYVSKFEKTTRTLTCQSCKNVIELKDPTYNEFFAIIDSRFDISNLLENNWEAYQETLRKEHVRGTYSDITDGERYLKFLYSLPPEIRFSFISMLFNADGAALYKSSNFSIWPIQCIVNELPYAVRTANPITCGIWFGKDKPDMRIFMKEFVLAMNKLGTEGVPCKVGDKIHHIRVFCPCCCVDSMARAPMQGMKTCTGFHGCNWCLHPGEYVKSGDSGAVKYTVLDDIPNRTEAETKQHMREAMTSKKPVSGLKCPSWLIHLLTFNIIWGFVPDPMHHVDIGLGKQFLDRWLTMLTPRERNTIDSIMKKIKVPNNVQRLSRSIKERKFWKAQEWENFILYYSLPILRAFPRLSQVADHWALLVEGYYKLMKATVTREEILSAHELFKEFVVKAEAIYSKEFMTFNLHQLLHLAQSVLDWGPLWSHSGYAFESHNASYLKQIHSPKGVVQQVCRSVSMHQSEVILRRHVAKMEYSSVTDYVNYLDYSVAKKTTKLTNQRYFGGYKKPSQTSRTQMQMSQNARIYKKMVKEGCLYRGMSNRSVRSDDSYARLANGSYIRIKEFFVDKSIDRSITVCKILQVRSAVHRGDLPSVIVLGESECYAHINTGDISSVCVAIHVGDIIHLTVPPNLYRN